MAVLAMFRAEGDPKDLLQRYDATLARATAQAPVRPEAHYCVPTDTGILIVDVWASREDLRKGVTENRALLAVWEEAGWPDETVEIYDIHREGWPSSD
jgi:hypothetical protein